MSDRASHVDGGEETFRLAIISTHPIQYYAPWFRDIAARPNLEVQVFFLFEPAAQGLFDSGFHREVLWDMPLLDGYRHEFVPNTSAKPGTGHFRGLRNPELTKHVRRFRPDAVLMIGYNYFSMMRFVLEWVTAGIPLILRGDSHRLVPHSSLKDRIKSALLRMILRRFRAFLYVGAANFRYFRQHGVPESALFRAPHAVDNARFMASSAETHEAGQAWRRELGIGSDRALVLFAGKFEKKKRPIELLRAFKACRKNGAALLFVGSGELEAELREEARGDNDVFFAPFQNQTLMPRTYAACDILVLPSFGPYETWGLAVNEAMCVGKPVIVSTHVGCAEDLVSNEETGLVFEAGNVDALRDALSNALQSRIRLRAWGESARKRIAGFSYAQATEGLLRALAHVGKKHRA